MTSNTMTRMTPLLEHNEQFARNYIPLPLRPPTAQVVVVTCLDHRLDPAMFLGLQLGDAPVIRNAGGRVTPAVIEDIAYLAYLAERLVRGRVAPDRLFEVAIIHHTECGTSFLADSDFSHQFAGDHRPVRSGARRFRGRRPAHQRPGRRGAPSRFAVALTEGERVRPRI